MERAILTAVYQNDFGATVDDVIGRAEVQGEECGRSWALNRAAKYLSLAGWNRGIRFYFALLSWDEMEELTESEIIDYLAEAASNEYERIHGADGELYQKRLAPISITIMI